MSELRHDSCGMQIRIGVGILILVIILVGVLGLAFEARTKGERVVQESAIYISESIDLFERDQFDRIHRSW